MSAFTERLEALKSEKHIMQKDISVALGISLRTYRGATGLIALLLQLFQNTPPPAP